MPFGAGCKERIKSADGFPCVTAMAVPPAATKGCCAISWAIVFKRWTGSPTSTQGPGYVGPRWNWTSRSGWYLRAMDAVAVTRSRRRRAGGLAVLAMRGRGEGVLLDTRSRRRRNA